MTNGTLRAKLDACNAARDGAAIFKFYDALSPAEWKSRMKARA